MVEEEVGTAPAEANTQEEVDSEQKNDKIPGEESEEVIPVERKDNDEAEADDEEKED